MTWSQYARARQLLAEETIGAPGRSAIAQEDAQHAAGIAALRRDTDDGRPR